MTVPLKTWFRWCLLGVGVSVGLPSGCASIHGSVKTGSAGESDRVAAQIVAPFEKGICNAGIDQSGPVVGNGGGHRPDAPAISG